MHCAPDTRPSSSAGLVAPTSRPGTSLGPGAGPRWPLGPRRRHRRFRRRQPLRRFWRRLGTARPRRRPPA
eukprot:5200941-Lingulodinium_polyedra.AAC.1